ncbi:MAG: hypothetical protein ACRD29_00960 [Acidimicrobiales bacterium]
MDEADPPATRNDVIKATAGNNADEDPNDLHDGALMATGTTAMESGEPDGPDDWVSA